MNREFDTAETRRRSGGCEDTRKSGGLSQCEAGERRRTGQCGAAAQIFVSGTSDHPGVPKDASSLGWGHCPIGKARAKTKNFTS